MLGSPAALVGRFVAESFRAKGEHANLRDSNSSATPISNSEEEKAQLYSDRLKAAIRSANINSLAVCLPYIQARSFSRAIAINSELLQTVEEIADHDEFPETVLKPCRSLLQSWKGSSNRTDDMSGRSQRQGAGNDEAHDDGAATDQDPCPDVGDLLHAVDD
jgi:hypothetical protein